MAWKIRFHKSAEKQLKKLLRSDSQRIISYLETRLLGAKDPRKLGKPLRGELSMYWRYRVGDFRIICDIQDKQLMILVIHIGHRRDVYR